MKPIPHCLLTLYVQSTAPCLFLLCYPQTYPPSLGLFLWILDEECDFFCSYPLASLQQPMLHITILLLSTFPSMSLTPDTREFSSPSMGSLRVRQVAESRTRLSDFTFTFHFHALEKETATHSSVLAWRIPGMGEPGGLLSMGSHRVGHD